MSEDLKCCLCFPIECGVKIIAALVFLSTGATIINACLEEGGLLYYMAMIIIQALMSLLWITNFISDGNTRKSVF